MTDVKRAIHDAYALFKLQGEGRGGDPVSAHNHAIAKGTWAGKVMAAVEKQPAPLGDILLFCYAPDWQTTSLDMLKTMLWAAFLKRHGDEFKQYRVLVRAQALAEVAIFNYQAQARRGPMPVEMVCQMAGIDRGNFYRQDRHWRRWWEAMGEILHRWERQALEQPRRVCEQIDEAREREREMVG